MFELFNSQVTEKTTEIALLNRFSYMFSKMFERFKSPATKIAKPVLITRATGVRWYRVTRATAGR